MNADQALRRLQRAGDILQAQAGGVGREHRVRSGVALELGKHAALGFQILGDGFDDQLGVRDTLSLGVGDETIERKAHAAGVALVTALEQLGRTLDGGRNALHRLILQGHAHATQRTQRGNVAAHHAGADHMHVPGRERAILAKGLQALLQEEHPKQVSCCWRGKQGLERGGLTCGHGEHVAVISFPDIDDGVGCRIVFAHDLCGGLLARLVGKLAAQGAVDHVTQDAFGHGQLAWGSTGQHHDARGCVHDPRRHAIGDQSQASGFPAIDTLAGQHHVQRRHRANGGR